MYSHFLHSSCKHPHQMICVKFYCDRMQVCYLICILRTRKHSFRMCTTHFPTVGDSVATSRCQYQWGVGPGLRYRSRVGKVLELHPTPSGHRTYTPFGPIPYPPGQNGRRLINRSKYSQILTDSSPCAEIIKNIIPALGGFVLQSSVLTSPEKSRCFQLLLISSALGISS